MQSICFNYAIYIKTSPDKLWDALTDGNITRQYWFGRRVESDWESGSDLAFWFDAGHGLDVTGSVLESTPYRHLSYTWKVEFDEQMRKEKPSRVAFEIKSVGEEVQLILKHDEFDSCYKEVPVGYRNGWPAIFSSLKSLLETGKPLDITKAG